MKHRVQGLIRNNRERINNPYFVVQEKKRCVKIVVSETRNLPPPRSGYERSQPLESRNVYEFLHTNDEFSNTCCRILGMQNG